VGMGRARLQQLASSPLKSSFQPSYLPTHSSPLLSITPHHPHLTARMVEVRELVAATKNQTPGQELQPKEVIATNAQIREHMRQLSEDYKELERLFLKEKNKRKV